MHYKLDFKLFTLWMLLLIQVLLVIFYLLMAPSSLEYSTTAPEPQTVTGYQYPVKFVSPKSLTEIDQTKDILGYLTEGNTIVLKHRTKGNFASVNGTVCYMPGTDIEYMKIIWSQFISRTKCECRQGWHGRDCGQPEVIWRAFIASRQKIFPTRRKHPRRIIHAFPITSLEIMLAEIQLKELVDVVDLFIVCESNYTETGELKSMFFLNKLKKGFLKEIQHKLLYIPIENYDGANTYVQNMRHQLWQRGRQVIIDLQPDDLFVTMNAYEIPNTKALLFFKLYDGWPQPVGFRLRWSVYGFYWQHPKKTTTAPGAWAVQFIEDVFHDDLTKIQTDDEDVSAYGIVVGDLNHYGGWYCSWCLDPKDIVSVLQQTPPSSSPVRWNRVERKTVDIAYIEDLIGAGLWLDGKTELLRKSQYQDHYFAPEQVLNNTWKYDFLLTNFYSKLDYN